MAIEIEPIATLVRFKPDDQAGQLLPYDAVATIIWESHSVAWIKGLTGRFGRRYILQLLRWAHSQGIELLKATRPTGHTLPFLTADADGVYSMDVLDLLKKYDRAYMDSQS